LIGNDERAICTICAHVVGTEIEVVIALVDRIIKAHRHPNALILDRD
jgi:hypothetical protein